MELKVGQVVECKNIICGKLVKCEVINPTYKDGFGQEGYAEVRIIEKFNGASAIVRHEDIVVEEAQIVTVAEVRAEQPMKGSARIEFSKYEKTDMFEEVEKRYLIADITTKSNNIENSEKLLDLISTKMEELDKDICFSRCYAELDDNRINDSFLLEFYYGEAEDTKKYIKDLFKQVKKSLGIR